MKQGTVPSWKAGLFLPISQEITLSPGKAGIREEREGPASHCLTLNGFSQTIGKGGHTREGHKGFPSVC